MKTVLTLGANIEILPAPLGAVNSLYMVTKHNYSRNGVVIMLGFLLAFSCIAKAQKNIKENKENMPLISFTYGYYLPAGDLANRFGNNSAIGGAFHFKMKNNIMFGAEGNFMFSRNVKENTILTPIDSDEHGYVFNKDGQISQILLFERGYTLGVTAGKVFPIVGPNPNSGVLLKVGTGFMQHKIRIEHQNDRIPQLEGEYIKGYDRLTNGIMLTQFIGYFNMSNNKFANFYIGLEFLEGFTQNRRGFNYDTKSYDTSRRMDIFQGVKIGWCIALYKRTANNYYYN